MALLINCRPLNFQAKIYSIHIKYRDHNYGKSKVIPKNGFYELSYLIKNVGKLKNREIRKIIFYIKKILKKAIIAGGSSIKNFSSSDGKKGGFQESFKVYGRKDKNCSNSDCSGKIVRAFLNNRSAFFCPKCQK